ncbi:MAG TPA: UbiH/UbiF/VisC/COQ6 family ubiquinone biosynthesis hydroxylase [Steroidobacteraceae bacterium]
MTRPDFDLLIIGGGMVGACLAALAAGNRELGELRIALLEAQPPTMPPTDREVDLRVSAISRGSQRILESIGAWPKIDPRRLCAYTDMVVWDATGAAGGAGSIHFAASESSEPDLGYIVENRRLQWAIYESASLRERVTVLRAELTGLEFGDDNATVSLADGRKVTAALVVGADGAASSSRKLAGIETSGWEYDQRAFVTHVSTQHPHRQTAWQRFLPAGPLAFLPLFDGRSSIVWTTTPDHAQQLVNCSSEQLANELSVALGGVLGDIGVGGPRAQFPLRLTHARNYCKPRFVLVGDAAHAVHPLAGQGVNLGLLDCAALVETLASELAAGGNAVSMAELRVLRGYERWRKSENVFALGLIDGLNRLFSNASPSLAWLRRMGLSVVDRNLLAKRFLMGRAMGTSGEVPRIAGGR